MSKDKIKKQRAFELDFFRGLSIVLMMVMHFAWNMRYAFGFDVFSVLESKYFWTFVEPFFLCIFVGVSGICCTFSRNNFFRGLKLSGVAILFSIATYLLTKYAELDCLILFNVLHMLGVSILIYSLIIFVENKFKINPIITNTLMGFFGIYILAVGQQIYRLEGIIESQWLLPFGILGESYIEMADYMALIPWFGAFLVGAVVGRTCYSERKSLIKNPPKALLAISKPFEFVGRHSLIIYVVHQPVIYGLTYLVVSIIDKV